MAAIKPDAFLDFRDVVKKTVPVKDELEQNEVDLAYLYNRPEWKVLEEYINTLKDELKNLNKSLMEKGADFEQIGRNAVVTQLATDLLDKVVTRVKDASEAVEKRRK